MTMSSERETDTFTDFSGYGGNEATDVTADRDAWGVDE